MSVKNAELAGNLAKFTPVPFQQLALILALMECKIINILLRISSKVHGI